VRFGRVPKNLFILAACPSCGDLQGAHHLVEGGTLALGVLGCEACGHAGKPAALTPVVGTLGGPPAVPTRVEMDSAVHIWPQTDIE
jgi:hypothetical protein